MINGQKESSKEEILTILQPAKYSPDFYTQKYIAEFDAGVFKALGVGWELPPKLPRIFYLGGGNSPCPILF